MIQIRNLKKSFGKQQVLNGITLDAVEGKTTVILGGSGQGKSVLLKHIVGLLRPDSGSIKIGGEEITNLTDREFDHVRSKLGMLFQDAALFDSMNVYDNVAFPLVEHGDIPENEIDERVHRALKHVDLPGVEEKWPSELSGGMRKRVGLARAIIHEPKYILYDEPTTGLDPVTSGQINWLINHTRDSLGITSLVISHDLPSTKAIADYIAMLYQGQIIEYKSRDEFFETDNAIVQSFLQGKSTDSHSHYTSETTRPT